MQSKNPNTGPNKVQKIVAATTIPLQEMKTQTESINKKRCKQKKKCKGQTLHEPVNKTELLQTGRGSYQLNRQLKEPRVD